MLALAEIEAFNDALRAARAEVVRLTEAADRTDSTRLPGWRWLFVSDERRAANTAAELVHAVERIGFAQIESVEPDREEFLHAVELARKVANPGWLPETLKDSTLGDVLAGILPKLVPSLPSPAWLKVALVVVGLVALAVLLSPVLAVFRVVAPRRA